MGNSKIEVELNNRNQWKPYIFYFPNIQIVP
jgi:hypothetical protein